MSRTGLFLTFVLLGSTVAAGAQTGRTANTATGTLIQGAQAQTPTAQREERQVTAAHATAPVRIDGALDDEVWNRAEPATGFIQSEPDTGRPATEPTEVRVAFDDDNLYIAAYNHDSSPSGVVVNNIRKDFEPGEQDSFEVIIDTFGDRRNGYMFVTNAEGARSDQQVANEGREVNASWDAIWTVRTQRVSDGWTVELAIPFKTLRFEEGSSKPWGINFSRRIRRKNEIVFWSPVDRQYSLSRVSSAGTLLGMTAASGGRNLRIKPYVLGDAIRGLGGEKYEGDGDVGLDVKYGVTPALTLDLTVRPDFAQVEVDEQQVNLTQFSQFFPEKREFFLENSGMFYVGDAARRRLNPSPTPDEDLLLFFSRRIGLAADGTPIPISGGARLTGQVAGVGVAALTIQTRSAGNAPGSNYTVLRGRKNLFNGSDVGALFMSREAAGGSNEYNRVYGVDANIRIVPNLDWSSYIIRTATPGIRSGQYAGRTSISWEGPFFHSKGGLLTIGEGFQNDLGYYRRIGARKWFEDTGLRFRSPSLSRVGIREFHPHTTWDYYTDQHSRMIAKKLHNGLQVVFKDGGNSEFSYNPMFQDIDKPLRLNRKAEPLPAGRYGWNEYAWRLTSNQSRKVAGTLQLAWGGLWSGTQNTVNANVALQPTYRVRVNIGVQRTSAKLDVPKTEFVSNIWTVRANYSFTTNMYLDSLLQYNRDVDQVNTNVRFNFIHHPLSDFFVVYNEQRFTTPDAVNSGRSITFKFTQMLAF